MSRNSTVIPFRQPKALDDPLSELAREGARRILAQVLIAGGNLTPSLSQIRITVTWRRSAVSWRLGSDRWLLVG
jgi:hypothetical protein